jgi:hypothetical protein
MTLRLNGSTSGYTEIDAPAVAGSNTLVLPTGNGSANQLLKNGGTAGALAFATATEDSSGDFAFNSGYGSVATAYGCRAWVNFDGTTATPSTIRGSGNVSSVTRNSTGVYTVNFATAMPDADYSIVGSSSTSGSGTMLQIEQTNTTSVQILVATVATPSGSNRITNCISIFR